MSSFYMIQRFMGITLSLGLFMHDIEFVIDVIGITLISAVYLMALLYFHLMVYLHSSGYLETTGSFHRTVNGIRIVIGVFAAIYCFMGIPAIFNGQVDYSLLRPVGAGVLKFTIITVPELIFKIIFSFKGK